MAGRATKNSQRSRAEAERARLYAARLSWHEGRISRRTRDNTLSGFVAGLIIVGAIISQSVHAVVTAPAPAPSETVAPAPLQDPFATLFPTDPTAE